MWAIHLMTFMCFPNLFSLYISFDLFEVCMIFEMVDWMIPVSIRKREYLPELAYFIIISSETHWNDKVALLQLYFNFPESHIVLNVALWKMVCFLYGLLNL